MMANEIVQLTGIAGAAATTVVVLRYVIQLIVVVWSLRADEAGRKHAIRLLELLRSGRHHRRRPP